MALGKDERHRWHLWSRIQDEIRAQPQLHASGQWEMVPVSPNQVMIPGLCFSAGSPAVSPGSSSIRVPHLHRPLRRTTSLHTFFHKFSIIFHNSSHPFPRQVLQGENTFQGGVQESCEDALTQFIWSSWKGLSLFWFTKSYRLLRKRRNGDLEMPAALGERVFGM